LEKVAVNAAQRREQTDEVPGAEVAVCCEVGCGEVGDVAAARQAAVKTRTSSTVCDGSPSPTGEG